MSKRESKVFSSGKEALRDIPSGAILMSGGFGLCGIPENSIHILSRMDIKNLTVISNNIGNSGGGLVALLRQKKISKAICSYVGGNPDLEEQMLRQEIEVELVPQGTFSERIRAGGLGIRAFYTPTGYGTLVAEGKTCKIFDRPCLLEMALHADFALVRAQKGDEYGNLWFKETAQNFNPLMAMAGKITIAEVEELLPLGEIPPHEIHLPGLFVQRIYRGGSYQNQIEILKLKGEGIS